VLLGFGFLFSEPSQAPPSTTACFMPRSKQQHVMKSYHGSILSRRSSILRKQAGWAQNSRPGCSGICRNYNKNRNAACFLFLESGWLAGLRTPCRGAGRRRTFPTTVLKLHVDFRMDVHMYCVSMWLEETFRFFDGTCHAMYS
jgi:hypothetical protein